MRTIPVLFALMLGAAVSGTPTSAFAQMMMPAQASASNTLAVTNPAVTLGTTINTTGSVVIKAGANPLNYHVTFTYLIMGMPASKSIQPALVNQNLAANGTRTISLVDMFTPTVTGMGFVEIEVVDAITGIQLTRSVKAISVAP